MECAHDWRVKINCNALKKMQSLPCFGDWLSPQFEAQGMFSFIGGIPIELRIMPGIQSMPITHFMHPKIKKFFFSERECQDTWSFSIIHLYYRKLNISYVFARITPIKWEAKTAYPGHYYSLPNTEASHCLYLGKFPTYWDSDRCAINTVMSYEAGIDLESRTGPWLSKEEKKAIFNMDFFDAERRLKQLRAVLAVPEAEPIDWAIARNTAFGWGAFPTEDQFLHANDEFFHV